MHQQFLPYAHQSIDQSDVAAVADALQAPAITRGPKVEAFENKLAAYCGAKYAVAFNSGSAALAAACFAADVGRHDRLITTPNTFVSSVGCGVNYGALPIFVDIDRQTGCLDIEQVCYTLQAPHSRGRNILLPVHFSGIAVDMRKLDSLIFDPGTIVIEDAAHAIGSCYPDGQKVGCCAWSQMTVFSFHPAKTITTGEGGMVTTNDEGLCRRLRLFRNNGIERDPKHLKGEEFPGYYEVQALTNNYHLTELQAALGLSQMMRIDGMVEKRRKLISSYRAQLKDLSYCTLFTSAFDEQTAYHLFVLQIDFEAYGKTRAAVMHELNERGVGTQVHYIPVYRHPVFNRLCGDIQEYFPAMEAYYAQALTLPLYPDLRLGDVERIVCELKDVLSSKPAIGP